MDIFKLGILHQHRVIQDAGDQRTTYGRAQIELWEDGYLAAASRKRSRSNRPLAYKLSRRGSEIVEKNPQEKDRSA